MDHQSLFLLIIRFSEILAIIPMASLVGVMIMVATSTFEWHSIKEFHKVPISDAIVMLLTMAVVFYTHDLAKGVITGVVLKALIFG